jgi:transposase-like protein
MGKRRQNRRWSLEEKRRVVQRMESCRHQDLADELEVDRRQLYAWRMRYGARQKAGRGGARAAVGAGSSPVARGPRQEGDGSGFLAGCLAKNRGCDGRATQAMAQPHLRRNRTSRAGARAQYEPGGQSLRQCSLRKFYQNAERGGNLHPVSMATGPIWKGTWWNFWSSTITIADCIRRWGIVLGPASSRAYGQKRAGS